MSYTVEKIANNKVKLSFVESAESFDAAVEKAYRKDRNFYFPLSKMPFPLAENNDALEQAVLQWDQTAAEQAWAHFCEEFGIREDGKAAARCADWILEKMKG